MLSCTTPKLFIPTDCCYSLKRTKIIFYAYFIRVLLERDRLLIDHTNKVFATMAENVADSWQSSKVGKQLVTLNRTSNSFHIKIETSSKFPFATTLKKICNHLSTFILMYIQRKWVHILHFIVQLWSTF
jgi:hypothetical protein